MYRLNIAASNRTNGTCYRTICHRWLSSTPKQRAHPNQPMTKERDKVFFHQHGMTRKQLHDQIAVVAAEKRKLRQEEHMKQMQAAIVIREEKKRIAELDHQLNDHLIGESQLIRKLKYNRIAAAKSIPFWLGSDSRAFDMTMEALNLKSRTASLDQKKSFAGVLSEYRELYLDSITSFLDKISLEDRPEHLTLALDKLANVRFADLKWAKNFRNAEKHKQLFDFNARSIITRQEKMKTTEQSLKSLQTELQRIEERKAMHSRESQDDTDTKKDINMQEEGDMELHEQTISKPQEKKEEIEGMISTAFNALSSFLGGAQNKETSVITAKEKKKEKKKEKIKEKIKEKKLDVEESIVILREKITKISESIQEAQRQIISLTQQQNELSTTLVQEDYEAAIKCVNEVMPIITLALSAHISERHASMIGQYQTLDAKTDLTKPHEWYLHARMDRRKIIFHGGPTNSGKTYTALLRLKEAKRGLYLGPLRLLAAEVYETLTSAGIYASLFTGQERREVPFSTHTAATMEMAPTDRDYDVVVIDEIQMLADKDRGHAWTRAFLGLRCKEIHICGGMEAESIARKIAAACGDEFQINRYERFSELTVADASIAETSSTLGSYKNVQSGDCVVAFSKNDIFAIKREIEQSTNHKCSVIYGSLPPETRTEQARRFNNPDSEYDVLVASDAIGMGLNLNIRRIIFNTIYKSDGENIVQLDHSDIKQIAGRAGRRNSPFPNGEVTCRDPEDLSYIQKMLSTEIAPVTKAGLLPTAPHIAMFSAALEKYGLSKDFDKLDKILGQFSDMATVQGDYFLCRQTPMKMIARHMRDLHISIEDKYTLTMAPVQLQNSQSMATLQNFALKYSTGQAAGISKSMIPKPAKSFDDIGTLCSLHNELELFIWLHNRFPANTNAVEQQTALAMKEKAIALINIGISESDKLKINHCYVARDQRLRQLAKKDNNSDKSGL